MKFKNAGLALFLAFIATTLAYGETSPPWVFKLPSLFSSNMVIQRDVPARVWGWGEPGVEVVVACGDARANVTVDGDGKWRIELPPQAAGGPHTLIATNGDQSIRFEYVMFGDVWVCSGQSNMAWPVLQGAMHVLNAEQEVLAANLPDMRMFTVPPSGADQPRDDIVSDGWQVCSSETVTGFSAVAYFFGRELHTRLGVPIGLVNSSYGGTTAESWTSREGLRTIPHFARILDTLDQSPERLAQVRAAFDSSFAAWKLELERVDSGYVDGLPVWAQPEFDDSAWPAIDMPRYWEDAGFPDLDGVMWLRKRVEVPESWRGLELKLHLCGINDRLRLWFNGAQIAEWSDPADASKGFTVPAQCVRSGENVIAARFYDMGGKGGFAGSASDMWLRPVGDGESIGLAGDWRAQPGYRMKDFSPLPRPPAFHPDNPNMPAALFNAMIAPLTGLSIKGVIWYQGEANASRAHEYRELFPGLIRDWRRQWDQDAFPFLFVQLANYMKVEPQPVDSAWAELREAQAMALELPNTAMAVTTDIGEADDIHPKNKQDVGKRLALAALAVAYGEDLIHAGPALDDWTRDGRTIRIRFQNVGTGLTTLDGGPLRGFSIADDDRRFVWADARIEGDSVVVSSSEVARPIAVRYNWANNPEGNLCNREGLPAAPFRTDDWPGITDGKVLELN